MTYLSVGAIFRDEADYLQEWIEFHRLVGVERFFLYDNGSVDDWRTVLAPYTREGIVEVHDWPQGLQYDAYNDCLRQHGPESRWIAFIDIDEFLFSPTGTPLPEMLTRYERWPGVGVHWCVYGGSGHLQKPDGLVIESYLDAHDRAAQEPLDQEHRGPRTDGQVPHLTCVSLPRRRRARVRGG